MENRSKRSLEGEGGSILVVTLLILFAVAVIGSSLAMISSMDLKISGNQRVTTQAFSVAEAGLNEAIHRIVIPPTQATIGPWTGDISIGDAKPYDPNWETRIYLTDPGAAPAGGGSLVNTGTIQDPNQPYLMYSQPAGVEGVLSVQHKWEDRNADTVRDPDEIVLYDPKQVPPENFTSGFPVEVITVTGQWGNATRSVQTELTKKTMLARSLGAMYIDKAIDVNGSPTFCGNNHDITIPVGLKPPACTVWHLPTGGLVGVVTTGDDVDVSGTPNILGDPTPMDTASTNPFYTLAETLGISDPELAQLLAGADFTAIPATGDPWDGITYIVGDADVNNNRVGSGLLYVTGNLGGNGDFSYKGIIFVEGDLDLQGGPWILGSVIVKGTGDYQFSAGNATVLYSEEAITTALASSFPAVILSWREL